VTLRLQGTEHTHTPLRPSNMAKEQLANISDEVTEGRSSVRVGEEHVELWFVNS